MTSNRSNIGLVLVHEMDLNDKLKLIQNLNPKELRLASPCLTISNLIGVRGRVGDGRV